MINALLISYQSHKLLQAVMDEIITNLLCDKIISTQKSIYFSELSYDLHQSVAFTDEQLKGAVCRIFLKFKINIYTKVMLLNHHLWDSRSVWCPLPVYGCFG